MRIFTCTISIAVIESLMVGDSSRSSQNRKLLSAGRRKIFLNLFAYMCIVDAYKYTCAYKIYFCIRETDEGDLFETESDNSNKPEWTLQSCFHPLFWVLKS